MSIRAEADGMGKGLPVGFLDLEQDALPLTEGAEDAAFEGPWTEHHLGPVGVTDDDPDARRGVVHLDDSLRHRIRPSRPCRP